MLRAAARTCSRSRARPTLFASHNRNVDSECSRLKFCGVRPDQGGGLFGATQTERKPLMPYVTVGKENGANVDIYYKDWGKGQPIVFSHGWPLSADDWDPQMLFFLSKGYRVIATARRAHGRSTQTGAGHALDPHPHHLTPATVHPKLNNPLPLPNPT